MIRLGYTLTPWQTIMRAHGDVIARARVFSQLAFQSNISGRWVAFPGSLEEKPKLWALGIPVGKDVFLLEPAVGASDAGPKSNRIATLQRCAAGCQHSEASRPRRSVQVPGCGNRHPEAIF